MYLRKSFDTTVLRRLLWLQYWGQCGPCDDLTYYESIYLKNVLKTTVLVNGAASVPRSQSGSSENVNVTTHWNAIFVKWYHCYASCYAGAALNRPLWNTKLKAACQHIFDCEPPEYETCVNHYTVTTELTVAFREDRNTRN